MIIKNLSDVPAVAVEGEGAKGATIRVMLAEPDGAPNFNFRVFDLQPGGNTFHHAHDYEHEIFVLEGKGEALSETEWRPIRRYDSVLIPPGETHQIRNRSENPLRVICIVPQQPKA